LVLAIVKTLNLDLFAAAIIYTDKNILSTKKVYFTLVTQEFSEMLASGGAGVVGIEVKKMAQYINYAI